MRAAIGMSVAAAVLLGSPAIGDETPRPGLVSVEKGERFTVESARGRHLALHFYAEIGTRHCEEAVRDVLRGLPTLAGIEHVFVVTAEPGEARSFAARFGREAGRFYLDSNHGLARAFLLPDLSAVPATAPATIVLDPEGKELFRAVGAHAHDHLSFADFAERFEAKTRAAALKDYNLPRGSTLAIEGYDPVSYFARGKAERGRPGIESRYRGVTYRFAEESHRAAFNEDPGRYAPTYGGWCASAIGAKGTKVGIDPTNFKVKESRLFLFYKGVFSDALKDWNKHEREWEPAADANWKRISGEDRTAARERGSELR